MPTPNAWDLRLALRALALALLALVVATLLTAATDEGGVAWGVRAGRTLPVTPVCAAVGTWIALLPSRHRGELLALETLGQAPHRSAVGAVLGGAAVAAAAAMLLAATPAIDVSGFYPAAPRAGAFHYEDGGFVDHARGWRVGADGAVSRVEVDASREDAPAREAVPRQGRATAAATTLLAGAALPLLAASILVAPRARRLVRALVGVALAAGASIFLFHAAAARTMPALTAAIPSAALLFGAVFGYRASPWWTRAPRGG